MSPARVLIVGAGLMGLFTAWWLRRAGVEVTLVDRGPPGREASWAGGGLLSPLYPWRYPAPVWALADWSLRCYPELVSELTRCTGVDAQWDPCGMVVLDQDDRKEALLWSRERGRVLEDWDEGRLCASVPGIGDHLSALYLPWAGQVRNPRLVRALVTALASDGVGIRSGEAVRGLVVDSGRVTGVRADGGVIEADAVVVAAGAWSAELLGDTAELPVTPVRGQMLLLRGQPGLLRHILLHRGRYVIPRRDGHVLVGSTMERTGFDAGTTATARAQLLAAAATMLPALGGLPLSRHWAGLRPASPNGVPLIGAHPQIGGLYVNAGQFRNGIAMAPASGRLMADLLLGDTPIVDPRPYAWFDPA